MNLYLIRYPNSEGTPGDLIINREVFCYTLEDKVQQVKIPGETCIPAGKYRVDLTYSERFERTLPLLLNVPGFDGIRMHGGNTTADTSGCILCGFKITGLNGIANCKLAIDSIIEFLKRDEINWIEIFEGGNG